MTKELQNFTNEELNTKVRVVIKDGEPWFVAKDTCDALDLANPTVVVSRLDEDERSKKMYS